MNLANSAHLVILSKTVIKTGAQQVNLKIALATLFLFASSGCIVVGGYSSGRGFWLWPGSIVFLLIGLGLLLLMFFRRR
ncbi:MAG TPA: hypothetical protein VFS90_18390 [Pyrinomonadaceae bacterium]|nr:hypothetical protein [Pyrinomonadaceae bacterium]